MCGTADFILQTIYIKNMIFHTFLQRINIAL